jgi:outer membrane receptor protein involved in Fe transport
MLTEKNASLAPEVSLAYDLGADHRFKNGSVLSVDLSDTIIHNVFEQLTSSTINPNTGGLEGIFSPINVAKLEAKVATLKYTYAPPTGVGFNLAAAAASSIASGLPASAYTVGQLSFPVNNVQICGNGVAAPGIPTCIPYLKAYAQVNFHNRSGDFVGLGVDFEGKNNAYFQPPMALVDFSARHPVSKNFEVALAVENLLNTNNYGTYLSTPNVGTPIVAGTVDASGNIQQGTFVPTRISAPARTVYLSGRLHIGR